MDLFNPARPPGQPGLMDACGKAHGAGNRQQATGNGQRATGNRRLAGAGQRHDASGRGFKLRYAKKVTIPYCGNAESVARAFCLICVQVWCTFRQSDGATSSLRCRHFVAYRAARVPDPAAAVLFPVPCCPVRMFPSGAPAAARVPGRADPVSRSEMVLSLPEIAIVPCAGSLPFVSTDGCSRSFSSWPTPPADACRWQILHGQGGLCCPCCWPKRERQAAAYRVSSIFLEVLPVKCPPRSMSVTCRGAPRTSS